LQGQAAEEVVEGQLFKTEAKLPEPDEYFNVDRYLDSTKLTDGLAGPEEGQCLRRLGKKGS